MTAAAPVPDLAPGPVPSDPQAIRAALPPALAAEFDREWDLVLERAKQSKDLTGVHELLGKWRHTAYQERREPGSHSRMLAKAEQILRTGSNPDAGSFEEMQALIRARLGRQVYRIVPDATVSEQVAALPVEALAGYMQVLEVLQVAPWDGWPQHEANPDAPVRRWVFGPGQAGQLVYLILEQQREVHLLLVQWWA